MRCIVCSKKIAKHEEICRTCKRFMDMVYENNSEDKEFTLEIFRKEEARRRKKKWNSEKM